MTDTTHTAEIVRLRKAPMTPAERQRRCRERKAAAQKATAALGSRAPDGTNKSTDLTVPSVTPVTPVTRPANSRNYRAIMRLDTSTALTGAAWAAAAVGVCINGWYARSLGSSDVAGWLFLGLGIVADVAALFLPTACARQRHWGPAVAGWATWLAVFVFAIFAGIGFAATNVSDVTTSRASRVTPAVTAAKTALDDASAARDRECKGGVGKYCREREAAVAAARTNLEGALRGVAQEADPQVEAASRIVSWLSAGHLRPDAGDFAMLRLMLFALLPQIGGVLLMVGRGAR